MMKVSTLLSRTLQCVPERAPQLLFVFCVGLVLLNAGRLGEWGQEGFRLYLTQAIMQTTLYDFGWVLLVTTWFLHQDAKAHGLRYWWVLPTYPFMPTLGLLAYFVVRQAKLRRLDALRRGSAP